MGDCGASGALMESHNPATGNDRLSRCQGIEERRCRKFNSMTCDSTDDVIPHLFREWTHQARAYILQQRPHVTLPPIREIFLWYRLFICGMLPIEIEKGGQWENVLVAAEHGGTQRDPSFSAVPVQLPSRRKRPQALSPIR